MFTFFSSTHCIGKVSGKLFWSSKIPFFPYSFTLFFIVTGSLKNEKHAFTVQYVTNRYLISYKLISINLRFELRPLLGESSLRIFGKIWLVEDLESFFPVRWAPCEWKRTLRHDWLNRSPVVVGDSSWHLNTNNQRSSQRYGRHTAGANRYKPRLSPTWPQETLILIQGPIFTIEIFSKHLKMFLITNLSASKVFYFSTPL